MKIILINAPPRAGKDTLGRLLRATEKDFCYRHPVVVKKFATAVKDMAHGAFNLRDDYEDEGPLIDPETFDLVKDQPHSDFRGATPRQIYIAVSERLMKPLFGQDIFGQILADDLGRLARSGFDYVAVVTDSGFTSEAEVLVRRFGRDNVHLVHVHRAGCTFAGDSRSFIDLDLPPENKHRIQNDGTMADLSAEAVDLLRKVVGR